MISFNTIDEAISRVDLHLEKRYWHFIRRTAYTAPPLVKAEKKLLIAALLLIVTSSPYSSDPARRGDVLRYTRHPEAWIFHGRSFEEGDWLATANTCAMIADILEIIEEAAE